MTEAGLLYSNARIKSMENSLVSPLQMGRLLDCETFSDAVKMLSEFGYTGGTAADDGVSYENLLDAERDAVIVPYWYWEKVFDYFANTQARQKIAE